MGLPTLALQWKILADLRRVFLTYLEAPNSILAKNQKNINFITFTNFPLFPLLEVSRAAVIFSNLKLGSFGAMM